MFTKASTYKIWQQKAWKPDGKNKTKKNPKLLWLGHMSFLICDVNIWEILSSPQVQNTARITVIQFPILNTQDEKYTADSPRVRPYSNKILSPNGLHSACRWCVVTTKIYRLVIAFHKYLDHIVIFKFMLQFGLNLFFIM